LVAGQTRVDVVTSDLRDDVLTTTVRVVEGQLPGAPLAPAGLYRNAPWREVLRLHRLVGASLDEATFETFDATETGLPGRYILQSWWTPDGLDMVSDMARVWRASRYAEDRANADFCLLSFQTFNAGDEAFTDGRGSWISLAAHHRFIERDELRLRHRRT
jgi:hypothetical protein